MNIKEYFMDEARERELVKVVRKTTRQWIIGNSVAGFFALIGVLLVLLVLFRSGSHGAELICLIIAVLLFPAIGVLIASAVARKGGRDILLARLSEKVYLTDDELVESYSPRFKEIDAAALVENHIEYAHITSVVHQAKACRYVINGCVSINKHGKFEGDSKHLVTENTHIVLYDYFYDMAELLSELEKRSGIKIQEEN